jgi:hypothetical protein
MGAAIIDFRVSPPLVKCKNLMFSGFIDTVILLTMLVNIHVMRVLMTYIFVIILLAIRVYLKLILHLIFRTLVLIIT